ncbi:MAG: endo alpha-1,4 polygalactosaminidase [Hyphomicrobiaceae bacterium]
MSLTPLQHFHLAHPISQGRRVCVAMLALAMSVLGAASAGLATSGRALAQELVAPRPIPAVRPKPTRDDRTPSPKSDVPAGAAIAMPANPLPSPATLIARQPPPQELAAARLRRAAAIGSVTSWGYQLASLDLKLAAAAPYGLLVVDATTGVGDGEAMKAADVTRLKNMPDGGRRLVVGYLSIGEAEDYRPDYFSAEYLEEDAPDWLMHENPQWKGNRIISFCEEGWQRTILGDENGRSVYNSIEPSPLYRLVELGLDGVYLDRVDVYSEVGKACPDAERRMVAFVKRLAEHARRRNPDFLVILQNAEELLRHQDMLETIDAIAKEDLFYGVDHSEKENARDLVRDTLANLRLARRAGRPVFFVDYVRARSKIADARRRGGDEGFIPYFGPRDLARLWLPERDF